MQKFKLFSLAILFIVEILFTFCFILNLTEQISSTNNFECQKRYFDTGSIAQSFVCVCNSTFCDNINKIDFKNLPEKILIYTSTKENERLKPSVVPIEEATANQVSECNEKSFQTVIRINSSNTFQTVFGFGGAFTDAVGINLESVDPMARSKLLESYFGENGIGYIFLRIPIGSTDFSMRKYSFAPIENDFDLNNFSLALEDYTFKIPYISRINKLTNNKLKLIATPWSAPAWMKTTGKLVDVNIRGEIKGQITGAYFGAFAKYFLKFFEEYSKEGIQFWGLTIANQPYNSRVFFTQKFEGMHVNFSVQRDFAKIVLGPLLKTSDVTKNIHIIALDEQQYFVYRAALEIYQNALMPTPIAGLATHYYIKTSFDDNEKVHNFRPDKFIISTEACTGIFSGERGPVLGDWGRGEKYGNDTLNSLRTWVNAWIDWNIILNVQGGPNWHGNYVDSPIIVDVAQKEFYKQPMFYFLAHFSKFIVPDSVRIESETFICDKLMKHTPETELQHVAFRTPSGEHILVIINFGSTNFTNIQVEDTLGFGNSKIAKINVLPRSIVTAIWKA